MNHYTSWTERQPAGNADKNWNCAAISADGTTMMAGIQSGRLYTSANSGVNWVERQPAGAVNLQWTALAVSSDGTTLVAGAWDGRLYTSADSGANWTERQPMGNSNRAWNCAAISADGTRIFVGEEDGSLFASLDSGVNWTDVAPAYRNWKCVACSTDGTKVVAGVWDGRFYVSANSGTSWTETRPAGNVNRYWAAVASSSNGTKLIAGSYWGGGRLYTTVEATAPTVTTAAVSEITTTTADSGGNVTSDGGASVTARGVCWSTSPNPDIDNDDYTEDGTGTGGFTSSLTGLDPGTTYYVRAYATNGAGTGYGDDVTFTTGIDVIASAEAAAYLIGGDNAVVDPGLEVIANTVIDFQVSITGNFATGDELAYTGVLPGGVTDSYNGTTGILSFTGEADAADWQALLRTVTFSTTSTSTATRTIAFTAGGAIPLEATGHFYQYVASTNINWTDAHDAAAVSTLFGLQGYLATITSQAENDFIAQKLAADAWVGGSDADAEGVWKWVTGPEAGTQFSSGSESVSGRYVNWAPTQPDNHLGNEHYLQIYSSGGGQWNDLPDDPSLDGYVVEYGGMPGDPILQITDTRDVVVTAPDLPTVTTTAVSGITSTTAISGGNVSADGGASVTARGVCWNTTGNPTIGGSKTTDGTGTGAFTSTLNGLAPGTTYYVRAYATNSVGTAYGNEVSFTAVNPYAYLPAPPPAPPVESNVIVAEDGTAEAVNDQADAIVENWNPGETVEFYTDPDGTLVLTLGGEGETVFSVTIAGADPQATIRLSSDETGHPLVHLTDARGNDVILILREFPRGVNTHIGLEQGGGISGSVRNGSQQARDVSLKVVGAGGRVVVIITNHFSGDNVARPVDALDTQIPDRVDITASGLKAGTVISIRMAYRDSDWSGGAASDLRLLHWNEATGRYEYAGINDLGIAAPTGILGDYGVDIETNTVWAEVEELGTFTVSRLGAWETDEDDQVADEGPLHDDEEDTSTDTLPAPLLCGTCGMAGAFQWGLLLFGMTLMKYRLHRYWRTEVGRSQVGRSRSY